MLNFLGPIEKLAIYAVIVVALVVGAFWKGAAYENTKWKAQQAADQIAYAKALMKAQEAATVVVTQYVKGDTRVQTVFKDRVIYKTKEIPHEVIVRSDSACGAIPSWFVGMWNSANQTRVPDAAETFDGAPTAVVLSDISAEHDREAEACTRTEDQLNGLKAWVRSTYQSINGAKAPY